jgi:sugar lactone lactonase YvrE
MCDRFDPVSVIWRRPDTFGKLWRTKPGLRLGNRDRRSVDPPTADQLAVTHEDAMPRYLLQRSVTAGVALTLLTNCDTSKSSAPMGTGRMTVTVTPADGTTPVVQIIGPGNYSKTIAATQILSGLSAGSYTVVADSAVGPDSIVGTIVDTASVTTSPATVTSGATATVTVQYATRSHVGGMWVGNELYQYAYVFASNQLRTTDTTSIPADSLQTGGTSGPVGLALDPAGNLWVDDVRSDTLRMFTPDDRNAAGSKTPSRVLVSADIGAPWTMQFDPQGNLWVINCGGDYGTLAEFTPSQLAAGGVQTAAAVARADPVTFCPQGIAWDGNGHVWVTDYEQNRLLEFTVSQISAGGTLTPIDSVGSNNGSLTRATSVIFDASGNLWVSTGALGATGGHALVEFTPAQLGAGGAPVPHTTITLPSLVDPYSLVFDSRGSLWVSDPLSNAVYAFTAAQRASGTATPAVTIHWASPNYEPGQILLDPYATPVHSAAPSGRRISPAPSSPAQPLGAALQRTVARKPPPER